MNWKFDFSPETSAELDVSEYQISRPHWVKIKDVARRLTHDGRWAM